MELYPPSAEDNINDLGRLIRELRKKHEIDDVSVDFRVLTKLARVLREAEWKVTLTLVATRRGLKLINVEPGNVEDKNYSIVIDIGTTTVCGQLLDLANCNVYRRIEDSNSGAQVCTLGEASDYNAQISYGEDVITRILYAQKPGGLKRIQEVVISTINGLIKELLDMSGVSVELRIPPGFCRKYDHDPSRARPGTPLHNAFALYADCQFYSPGQGYQSRPESAGPRPHLHISVRCLLCGRRHRGGRPWVRSFSEV